MFSCALCACVLSPWETLGTMRTHVWFLHSSLVGSDMIAHPILPLKTLLADGTRVRLFIWVGQAVPIQMVDVPKSLPTCLTRVVLSYWVRVRVRVGAGVGVGTGSRWNRVWGCDWDWDLNRAGKAGVLSGVVGWSSLEENEAQIYSLSEFLTVCEFWEEIKSLIHENNLLLTSNTHHRTSVSVNIQSIEWGNGSVTHWYWGLWGFSKKPCFDRCYSEDNWEWDG